jgi:hypothetical protein
MAAILEARTRTRILVISVSLVVMAATADIRNHRVS